MWAKTALLSAILAASAFVAPVSAQTHVQSGTLTDARVFPIQYQREGRGGRATCPRPFRDAVEELRQRYGGSFGSSYECLEEGGRCIYLILWRMPDGQLRQLRVSGD